MLQAAFDSVKQLMTRGGWVMWPLLLMSLVSLTLIFERAWFWLKTNNPRQRLLCQRVARLLRDGQAEQARMLLVGESGVYGDLVSQLLNENASDAAATDAIETQRPRLDRFMPTLGTVITAAPMLGILGTVTGIISAFQVLSDKAVTDPSQVAGGIAEALLTTVAGLVVALVVLFPFNAFRAQIDRTMGRMENLIGAAQHTGRKPAPPQPHHPQPRLYA